MRRRILTAAVLLLVIAAGWFLVRQHLTLEEIAAHDARLRSAIVERPVRSVLLGLLVFIGLSFVPMTAGKSIVFGWLFGLWRGIVIANVGLTVAAIGMFLLGRYGRRSPRRGPRTRRRRPGARTGRPLRRRWARM